MTTYGKSPHITTVFQEFLGAKNTLIIEGEEWRADRRMIAYVDFVHCWRLALNSSQAALCNQEF